MVTLPTKAHIGKRLTIALRDSHGNTRELLGILLDPKTIRTRDGASESFDPDAITNWRVVSEVATKAGRGAPLSMRVREIDRYSQTRGPEFTARKMETGTCDSQSTTVTLPTAFYPPEHAHLENPILNLIKQSLTRSLSTHCTIRSLQLQSPLRSTRNWTTTSTPKVGALLAKPTSWLPTRTTFPIRPSTPRSHN